jgi:CO/xanthine dehydrogenase Mo-binding subunit
MRNHGLMCFSNHASGAAMRAFGDPEAFFAGESMMRNCPCFGNGTL